MSFRVHPRIERPTDKSAHDIMPRGGCKDQVVHTVKDREVNWNGLIKLELDVNIWRIGHQHSD